MPAHNEQDYLEAAARTVIEGLVGQGESFELLVVENGSTDATWGVAAALTEAHPEVRALSLAAADYGGALRSGLLAASGEWVVCFDVDYVDLTFLTEARLVAERTGAAIVVGSKRLPGADDQRGPGRRLVTAVFSLVLRWGFGLEVTDTHGLKLLRRAAVAPHVEASTFGGDIFDTEVVLRAERAGLTVREVPVRVMNQRPPRTSILHRIPRSLLGLVRLWRSLRVG